MMRKCRLNRPSKPFSRLASVPLLKLPVLALSLAALLALVLAACGGGSGLLSGTTASEIESNLDRVPQLVSDSECAAADQAVAEVSEQVRALEGVDSRLKEALSEGVEHLEGLVANCEEVEAGEESEAVEESEEGEEEETQQKPEKTEKEEASEREPQEKEPTTTPEEGEQTTPEKEETEATEESESSGGIGPGSPAGEG